MDDRVLTVAEALIGPDYRPTGPVEIVIRSGRIARISPATDLPAERRILAMPALVDAHNHARPLSPTSFGAGMKPLETWLLSLAGMPAVDPYLAAAASLGRSLRGGCVGAMVHLVRSMGKTPITEEARELARAARDVGMSIGFAVAMRDRNPVAYGDDGAIAEKLAGRFDIEQIWRAESMSPQDQVRRVVEVAAALEAETHVDVQFGPNGVQWCSDALLEAIARASDETGRRIHMHLLETREQRVWADRAYPHGMISRLKEIGLLSPRLTVAHCVWARPHELAMLASEGVRIVVNPSSNLHLRSGIARVDRMKDAGVRFSLGLDGCAFDEDDDALREMRLFRMLNAGIGFDERVTITDTLAATCNSGRHVLGMQEGGRIEEGMPADLLLLDLDRLDRDGVTDVDPRHFLFARASRHDILEVITGGRTILRNGDVLGIDLDDIEKRLRAQYKAAAPDAALARQAFEALEPLVEDHYRGCC